MKKLTLVAAMLVGTAAIAQTAPPEDIKIKKPILSLKDFINYGSRY